MTRYFKIPSYSFLLTVTKIKKATKLYNDLTELIIESLHLARGESLQKKRGKELKHFLKLYVFRSNYVEYKY